MVHPTIDALTEEWRYLEELRTELLNAIEDRIAKEIRRLDDTICRIEKIQTSGAPIASVDASGSIVAAGDIVPSLNGKK